MARECQSGVQHSQSTPSPASSAADVITEFLVTAYCACILCTGNTHGITKSGFPVRPGIAACDKKLLNRHIWIEGLGVFSCKDTGRLIKGHHIDIYIESHQEALKFGKKKINGRILNAANHSRR
jgi:3D (Asp-Asp-Asp) domain-containing protein